MDIAGLLEEARRERRALTEVEAQALVEAAGIPVVETRLASTPEEAAAAARELGFPAVVKVVSPDIPHKSEVGGVKVGLRDGEEVARAAAEVLESARRHTPKGRLLGVAVQPMAPAGVEVILGAAKDPQFGPFLMFGLGGVWVEVLQDVAFRLVPISRRDARQMLREVKGFPLLQGTRGRPPVDLARLEEALLSLSAFVEAYPEIRELEVNPLMVYPEGVLAVDARAVLEG